MRFVSMKSTSQSNDWSEKNDHDQDRSEQVIFHGEKAQKPTFAGIVIFRQGWDGKNEAKRREEKTSAKNPACDRCSTQSDVVS